MFLKKDGRLCMCADSGWKGIRFLQFDGVIFEPGIGNDFVACGDSLKGNAISAAFEPVSRKVNFDFGSRISRIESSYHVAHVVIEPGMKIEHSPNGR